MATCKIIPVKLRLDNALDYIRNGDKTESGDWFQELIVYQISL